VLLLLSSARALEDLCMHTTQIIASLTPRLSAMHGNEATKSSLVPIVKPGNETTDSQSTTVMG